MSLISNIRLIAKNHLADNKMIAEFFPDMVLQETAIALEEIVRILETMPAEGCGTPTLAVE